MADSKVADLTEDTGPLGTDLVYVVHDPSGTPADRKVKITNLRSISSSLRITSGDYGTGSIGFGWREPFGSTSDIAVSALAGDLIEVSLNGQWNFSNSTDFLDVVAVTSYQHFGDGTTAAVTSTTGNGAPGWASTDASNIVGITGSVFRTLVSGDITTGTVTLRVIARTSAGRTLRANSTTPLLFTVRNHRQ